MLMTARLHYVTAICILLACASGLTPAAAVEVFSPVNSLLISVDPSSRGLQIPRHFVGLSFELSTLWGARPNLLNNGPLTNILSVLAKDCTVRIGGKTSDVQTPSVGDFSAAVAVAKEICGPNYQIWGLAWQAIAPNKTQAQQGKTDAAQVAQLLRSTAAPEIYIQIGNEPNFYRSGTETFEEWRAGWNIIKDVIESSNARVKFAGPDVATPSALSANWVSRFADKVNGMGSPASMLTLHCYGPKQTGNLLRDINSAFEDKCASVAHSIPNEPSVAALRVPLVVTEAGSFLGAGTEGLTLAAALYDLRNMIIFAENGWKAMNFHGTPATTQQGNPSYSPIGTNDGSIYHAQATLYAMLAFQQLAGGDIISLTGAKDGAALAVLKDKQTKVLVLNQNFLEAAAIKITSTGLPREADVIFLAGSSFADLNATLGGATVSASGAFNPRSTSLPINSKAVSFTLCASCAAIVTLQ
jgi:hypothetical protein